MEPGSKRADTSVRLPAVGGLYRRAPAFRGPDVRSRREADLPKGSA